MTAKAKTEDFDFKSEPPPTEPPITNISPPTINYLVQRYSGFAIPKYHHYSYKKCPTSLSKTFFLLFSELPSYSYSSQPSSKKVSSLTLG